MELLFKDISAISCEILGVLGNGEADFELFGL